MKKCVVVFVLSLCFSCKERALETESINFYFQNAQPAKDSELNKIPIKFRGIFVNKDSVFLKIEENRIIKFYHLKFKIHTAYLDSLKKEFRISDEKLISKETSEIYYIKKIGDSLELISTNSDTLFKLSNYQKAKRLNKYLILNTKDSIFWKLKWIKLNKNSISINYLSSLEDLKTTDSLTKVKSEKIDSISFIIKPTRYEFKKLLQVKRFDEKNDFKRTSI